MRKKVYHWFFPLLAVPVRGVETVRQKDKTFAACMLVQPFPHAAGFFAVLGQGHMPVLDQSSFFQPQGQSLKDTLVIGKGAAFHIDHPPYLFFVRIVLCRGGKGAVPEQQGQEQQAGKHRGNIA